MFTFVRALSQRLCELFAPMAIPWSQSQPLIALATGALSGISQAIRSAERLERRAGPAGPCAVRLLRPVAAACRDHHLHHRGVCDPRVQVAFARHCRALPLVQGLLGGLKQSIGGRIDACTEMCGTDPVGGLRADGATRLAAGG